MPFHPNDGIQSPGGHLKQAPYVEKSTQGIGDREAFRTLAHAATAWMVFNGARKRVFFSFHKMGSFFFGRTAGLVAYWHFAVFRLSEGASDLWHCHHLRH